MKRIFAFVLYLCLAGAVLSGTSTATCDKTQNPFLNWFSGVSSGVVLASPETSSTSWSICSEIWNTADQVGSCCNADKLLAAYQTRIDSSKNSWGKFMSSSVRLRNKIEKIRRMVKSVTLDDIDLMKKNNDFANADTWDAATIFKIIQKINSFQQFLDEFKRDGKKCFATLGQYRANVYCNGCWAFGGSYFTANTETAQPPKFSYSGSSCNTLMATCGTTWNYIYLANAIENLAGQIARKRKNAKTKSDNTLKFFVNPDTDASAFNTAVSSCYGKFELSASCTQENLDVLCSGFFSWSAVEPLAKEVKSDPETDNLSNEGTRILTTGGTDYGSSSTSPTGANLATTVTLGANYEIDTSAADSSSTSSYSTVLVASFVGLMSTLALLF